MNYPKISIVTPSYNQAEFIEETILSVISQNYPNLEYIIIDGGSTDGSVEIIRKYEKYLAYWISEPDKGQGDALNKGFAKSTGDILAILNSDDKYHPWALETVAQIFLLFSDVNWICGIYTVWNRQGFPYGIWNAPKNIYDYILYPDSHFQEQSIFWRRALWNKAGGSINENFVMLDRELWGRFFLHDDLWNVQLPLGGFRSYGTNMSVRKLQQVKEEDTALSLLMESKLSENQQNILTDLRNYIGYIRREWKYIKIINNAIDSSKWFKVLPHFLYFRIKHTLRTKIFNSRIKKIVNLPANKPNIAYKTIYLGENGWSKGEKEYFEVKGSNKYLYFNK